MLMKERQPMERFDDVPGGSCHDCFACQAYRFLQEPSPPEEMHGGYWHFAENPRQRRHGCHQLVSPMVDKHYYVKARFEENRSSLCGGSLHCWSHFPAFDLVSSEMKLNRDWY
ncbi:hypothetical protein V6Z11_D05G321600 [Gossypium hirsutum]